MALALGPWVRRAAVRFDFYDRPDGGLKPHDRPIPYLGGLAIYGGWLAALAIAVIPLYFNVGEATAMHPLIWIAIGGTLLMITGLIDDRRHLPPLLRLAIQATAAGVLVGGGVGLRVGATLLEGSIDPAASTATVVALSLLSVVVCAFLIAGATNATNLIDGMDGLCAGCVGISALGFMALVAVLAGQHAVSMTGATIVMTLSAAVLGACAAFLFYNFNPASMFMGDSGSLLLGFSAAAIMILFAEHAGWRGLIGSIIIFGFPIFDTALAVGRRRLNGRPLFKGDRSHFYDQIRDRGASVRRTVLICYALQAGLVLIGLCVALLPMPALLAAPIVLLITAFLICRRMGFLRVERDQPFSK